MTALTGTRTLTGLALRRDRVKLSAYVLGLAALGAGMYTMYEADTRQAVADEVELFAESPALRMFGVASDVSVGGAFALRGVWLLSVLAALMSALAVVRHSRQNEETGRAELVGAAVVGRRSLLAAALIVTVGGNVVLAGLLALAGIASGQPAAGSLTAGLAVGAFGSVFAGVAAVTAQLSSTSRGANGLAAAGLGLAFVLSGVGNVLGTVDPDGVRVTSAWPAWLSPMGWAQQTRPFGGDDWWPLALSAAAFAVLVAVAAGLAARRDVGRGILAERRGRAEAARALLSPVGLAWRLQRGALLGWAAGMAGFGVLFGAIIDEIAGASGSTAEWYARMGGSDVIVDAYRASISQMIGMAVAVYAVQTLLRMHAEEADGRLEPVLATAVSRLRWMLGHVVNAVLGSAALLLVFAVGMGVAAGAMLGDVPAQLADMTVAALLQLPGILAIGGVVVAVTSLLPRWAAPVSWSVIIASLLLGPMFGGATMQLPGWAQDLSPFTHIPKAPAADVGAVPVVALIAIAVILTVAGLAAFRRRNLALPA